MEDSIRLPRAPLEWSLFGLRIGVGIVMAMWTIDKFVNPEHAAAVFGAFYGLPGLDEVLFYLVGLAQALILLSFLVGFMKRWSTLLVLIMHLVSTLAPLDRYLDPWTVPNLLFFAAWPMLAAIVALYLLRDYDIKFSLEGGGACVNQRFQLHWPRWNAPSSRDVPGSHHLRNRGYRSSQPPG